MSELRWILLGIAAVVLAAIYLSGRRAEKRSIPKDEALQRARTEITPPHIGDDEPVDPLTKTLERHIDDDLPIIHAEARHGWKVETLPIENSDDDAFVDSLPIAEDDSVFVDEPQISPAPSSGKPSVEWPIRSTRTSSTAEPIKAPPVRETSAPIAQTSAAEASRRAVPRPERRRIFALRLSAEETIPGDKLRAAFEDELLHHGKYGVFHRRHLDGATIFSVADIGEPGSFDPEQMDDTAFAGITLFTQLPGPVPAEHAFNDMLACASRLQQALGGRLQDERGLQLTSHRTERMREEVRGFEQLLRNMGDGALAGSH